MLEERSQQGLLTSAPTDRLADGPGERFDFIREAVGQVVVLGVFPDLLIGVEFRGVRRQPLDMNATRKPAEQSPGPRAVDRPSIDHQDHPALQTTQQRFHETLEIIGDDVVIVDVEVEPEPPEFRRHTDGRYDREPIATVSTVMDGRLALGSPGAPDHRWQHEAAFI